ncbi:MAG: AIM24 family protein, partial [Termitinemataceae bacterium]
KIDDYTSALRDSVSYTINKASRGLFTTLASGEGLVCRFRGPGKVWIQTRNISALAQVLRPYFPSSGQSNS